MPFFEKPVKAKIKQLSTKKLLSEQLLYKQPINDDISISRNERAFRGYGKTYKAEMINNRNLSDSLSVNKNSKKNLFDKSFRGRRGFKYIISVKIILKE